MASNTDTTLAERTNIHKSCKSLENLLSVLNDYCEAAGTMVLLHKKLAKALRETAGMKVTGGIAANAMNASATIFETSVDVNTRFAKFVDKEYDSLSAEVKKWFKKLAKEEKLLDERMNNANAKIKQAGHLYEKKTKKNPQEAAEEHARYINLISTLGPEISREKHNHALLVTERHTSTTYSAAACLSRIADAEWLRTCECVKRFAPAVGQLGEWRPLCEGGWRGSPPEDLPDVDAGQQTQSDPTVAKLERPEYVQRNLGPSQNTGNEPPREAALQRRSLPSHTSTAEPAREYLSYPQDHLQPNPANVSSESVDRQPPTRTVTLEPPRSIGDEGNMDSIRSLSAFPLPPTHFPLPPPRQPHSSQSSSTAVETPTVPRFTESPTPDGNSRNEVAAPQHNTSPVHPAWTPAVARHNVSEKLPEEPHILRPLPSRSQTLPPPALTAHNDADQSILSPSKPNSQPHSQFSPDTFKDHEFGVKDESATRQRSETVRSTGSLVAAMRDRFSQIPETTATTPPPKDLAVLPPLNVNNLATRYQSQSPPPEVPSPRLRRPPSTSLSHPPPPPPIDTQDQTRERRSPETRRTVESSIPELPEMTIPAREDEVLRRHQQRVNDLAQLELREKELQLLQRERQLERRAQELAENHSRLMNEQREGDGRNLSVGGRGPLTPRPQPMLRPRDRTASFQASSRPPSQVNPGDLYPGGRNGHDRVYTQQSYSTSHLVPPSPSISSGQAHYSHDGQSSFENRTSTSVELQHGPNCGCTDCSAVRYKPSPTIQHLDFQPTERPIEHRALTEKPKSGGWMKRFSMPVGNAFGVDSKKGVGHTSAGFTLDGKKNPSNTMFRNRRQ